DPRVVAGGRIQVVVVALDARLGQVAGLVRRQQPEAGTDLHRELLLDPANSRGHLPQLTRARAATAGDDAIGTRLAGPRLVRTGDEHVRLEHRVLRNIRGRDDRLRAVAAVL